MQAARVSVLVCAVLLICLSRFALDCCLFAQIHAADVVQNIHVLLLGFMAKPSKDCAGALCTSLTPLDVLSCIIAAAIHDVGHTGTVSGM